MILLLGGTTEAGPIARALVEEGYEVLLSTATAIPSRGGLPSGIRQRTGQLDARGLVGLIRTQGIRAVVDATHPYAAAISANAWRACRRTRIPFMAYDRPRAVEHAPGMHWAADHQQAAALACLFGRHVLLTIGSRNLAPYVAAARPHGIKLVARVLDHPSSIEACGRVGLNAQQIVCATGPFSVTENTSLIARHHIDVLVTKDSGEAGGFRSKIAAARDCGCRVVVVNRPPTFCHGHQSICALMEAIRCALVSDRREGSPPPIVGGEAAQRDRLGAGNVPGTSASGGEPCFTPATPKNAECSVLPCVTGRPFSGCSSSLTRNFLGSAPASRIDRGARPRARTRASSPPVRCSVRRRP